MAFALLFAVVPVHVIRGEDLTLQEYTIARDRVTLSAMSILASWSAVNLVAGTTLSFTTDDPQLAAFHQMNAGWNIVNAALAVPSLLGARSRLADPPALTLSEAILEQNALEDTLLFNAGIDFAYIATGFYLTERARRGEPNAAQLEGFGWSLMLQGGFLLVFDLATYFALRDVGVSLARHAELR